MIYVRSKDGKALMPSERGGRIGYLLRHGKAHVVSRVPFIVQLDYESTNYTQEVSLGIDAGSKHIGVSASSEKRELLAAQVELRSDVVNLLSTRRELRRARRNRKTRYRKVRFDNRKKKDSWLAPSIEQKVESHLKVIRLVHKLLPITKTTIEVAQFDAQKIKNTDIKGNEYQHGEQMGFWNVREYVLARDGHKCIHCKGKSKDPILNVHHLESRKTGGNSPSNLVTLCETCHKAYHRGEFELKIKRGTTLRDAAVMNIMRWAVYEQAKEEFRNVHLTYGYVTKHTRIENGITKTHAADAFCIAKTYTQYGWGLSSCAVVFLAIRERCTLRTRRKVVFVGLALLLIRLASPAFSVSTWCVGKERSASSLGARTEDQYCVMLKESKLQDNRV